ALDAAGKPVGLGHRDLGPDAGRRGRARLPAHPLPPLHPARRDLRRHALRAARVGLGEVRLLPGDELGLLRRDARLLPALRRPALRGAGLGGDPRTGLHRGGGLPRRVPGALPGVRGLIECPPIPSPRSPAAPGLHLAGLTCRPPTRPEPTIAGLDLEIPAGQRVLLAGASGSGKSTVLRALAGLLDEESGEGAGLPAPTT